MREFFTGLTDGRRVNERHNLFDIVHNKTVEKLLIAVLKGREKYILLNVVSFTAQITQGALFMRILPAHIIRQKPAQT